MAIPSRISTLLYPDNLCHRCAAVDLESLINAPWLARVNSQNPDPNRSVVDFEMERAVYITDFSLADIQASRATCSFCQLLAACARMTGDEAAMRDKQCCIRPKLKWTKSSSLAASASKHQSPKAILAHSGQLHVWFDEYKRVTKPLTLDDTSLLSKLTKRTRQRLLAPEHQGQGVNGHDERCQIFPEIPSEALRHSPLDPMPSRSPVPTASSSWKLIEHSGQVGKALPSDAPVKSAVGSWRIEIVGKASESNRVQIPDNTDLELLHSWFLRCVGEHCHHDIVPEVSSRLTAIREAGLFRAIHTSTGKLATPRASEGYAALSYVWGAAASQIRVTHGAQEGLQSYAPTLRDAANLAKTAGLAWLWVDRICIDQANNEEKAALIPYMKDIFSGAELTIVAAAGDGAHAGLPGAPDTPRRVEQSFDLSLDAGTVRLLPAAHSFNTLNKASVWHTRGWTFEEYVFSHRLLYVFPSEIIFSCSTGTFRESTGQDFVPEPAGSTWGDGGTTPPSIDARLQSQFSNIGSHVHIVDLPDYVRAIEEYTARELTVEEDRVAAFAGLVVAASRCKDYNGAEKAILKHGHPLAHFETLLTWQNVLQYDEDGLRQQQTVRHPTSGKHFAPSWSWAAAGTKVQFLSKGAEHQRTPWFSYSTVGERHVLAQPTTTMTEEIFRLLGLSGAEYIQTRRPWEVTGLLEAEITQLHIVTVTFNARLYPTAQASGGLVLESINDARFQVSITEHWSIVLGSPTTTSASSIHWSRPRQCCIIAGLGHIYIMALQDVDPSLPEFDTSPWPRPVIASRLGVCRISHFSGHGTLMDIMTAGHARWQHICIV